MKLLVSLMLLTATCLADPYFVEPTTGNGVSSDIAMSTTELIRNAVTKYSSLARTPEEAKMFLVPKLLQLGNSLILSLSKEDLEGKTLYSSRLKAARAEELDTVTERLTRAVINEVDVNEDARVTEITEEESKKGSFRRTTRKGSYFGIGPAWLSNLNNSSLGYMFSGGYFWDTQFALVRLRTDFAISGSAIYFDAGLGLSYFFTDKDIAPFLGAEFGFGIARLNGGSLFANDTVNGFTVGATAGFHLLRTTGIQIELAARVSTILNSGTLGNPALFGLRVGILF